jgi:hypothetical protein
MAWLNATRVADDVIENHDVAAITTGDREQPFDLIAELADIPVQQQARILAAPGNVVPSPPVFLQRSSPGKSATFSSSENSSRS